MCESVSESVRLRNVELASQLKIGKCGNVNIGILYNPYGAMRSIMYVFDNFGHSRTFRVFFQKWS